jgi:hypothetical protein
MLTNSEDEAFHFAVFTWLTMPAFFQYCFFVFFGDSVGPFDPPGPPGPLGLSGPSNPLSPLCLYHLNDTFLEHYHERRLSIVSPQTRYSHLW